MVVKDRGKNRLADTEPMTTNGQPTHGTHGQRWRLTVYRQNIEHHVISRTKLKFSELDDDQAKAALRSTIRHEMMHRCKGDSGDADGGSCNHYFIDFSIATELCAQIAQIAAALEAVEDEEEQQKWLKYLQLLCNDYNYIKDKWGPLSDGGGTMNPERNKLKAARCWCDHHEVWESWVEAPEDPLTPGGDPGCPGGNRCQTYMPPRPPDGGEPTSPTPCDQNGDPHGPLPEYPVPACPVCDQLFG